MKETASKWRLIRALRRQQGVRWTPVRHTLSTSSVKIILRFGFDNRKKQASMARLLIPYQRNFTQLTPHLYFYV
jgi:hypothetical protein